MSQDINRGSENPENYAKAKAISDLADEKGNVIKAGLEELVEEKRKAIHEGLREYADGNPYLKKLALAAIPSVLVLVISIFFGSLNVPFLGNVFKKISDYVTVTEQGLTPIDSAIVKSDSSTDSTSSANPNSISKPEISTANNKNEVKEKVKVFPLEWYPILFFGIFVYIAIKANKKLKSELLKNDSTESEIDRVIDKYVGVVDGIGTALPLIGAAVILFTVGAGRQEQSSEFIGNAHNLFLGFAVPFEIKSIFILAIAKLFESVFDEMALQYQEIMEKVKNKEREFLLIRQAKSQSGAMISSKIQGEELNKLVTLSENFRQAAEFMNSENVSENMKKFSGLIIIDSKASNSNIVKNENN
jgi:hypothetical protein